MKKKFYYKRPSKKSYIITIPTVEHGTITGPAVAYYGDKVTLTITPDSGYQLDTLKVMCDGKEISVTDGVFTMPDGNVEITATFKERIVEKYVDLGLSIRWASYNVGATNPEEYGNYYAWGEIATKDTYNWSTYKYADGSRTTLTKYCNDASYGKDGFTDTLTTLEVADDAATQNWGGNWRMPTIVEWQELRNNCTWTWTNDYNNTGVAGNIVTSKTNGNSIFLPAAGYRSVDGLYDAGSRGSYWSSSLNTGCPANASGAFFNSGVPGTASSDRDSGWSIRPVLDPYKLTLTYDTAQGTATLSQTKAYEDTEITVNVTPSSGYELSSITVNGAAITGNTFTMPDSDVSVVVEFKSSTPSEYTITVNLSGGYGVVNHSPKAESGSTQDLIYTPDEGYEVGSVTIKCGSEIITPISGYYKDSFIMPEGDVVVDVVLKEVEGVDLGGSVLWAPYNVGAWKPDITGEYFAWGETSSKEIYNWASYDWCNGAINTLTKYNTNSTYGNVDNKTILEATDDVATVRWGNGWRMPTYAELEELDSLNWDVTTDYQNTGHSGAIVTNSTTGNSIFIPCAGFKVESELQQTNEADFQMGELNCESYTDLDSVGLHAQVPTPEGFRNHGYMIIYRYAGRQIRPVKSKS